MVSTSSILAVASVVAAANAEDIVQAVFDDINANLNEYLPLVAASSAQLAPLLSLYFEAKTYTDDSYTTLVSPELEGEISAFATGLSWYSSRILPELGAATSAVPSTEASSSAPASSAPASSSSAPASSSPAPSSAASSAESSSAASSAASSEIHSVSSAAGAVGAPQPGSAAYVMAAGLVGLLSGVALL
ncbi:DEKNAAC100889 [Brettanomyces naardenensis]|uniref:DEKNAAC100889 n=1 Tax=Brettanomyces naardenensis TaxID=13370 RepID=A0A448YEE6_BRENA|nr:DEKNAAC100889 [Brettanomyces naardenensis]